MAVLESQSNFSFLSPPDDEYHDFDQALSPSFFFPFLFSRRNADPAGFFSFSFWLGMVSDLSPFHYGAEALDKQPLFLSPLVTLS